eukprot:4938737-Amphidinium_carterae.1
MLVFHKDSPIRGSNTVIEGRTYHKRLHITRELYASIQIARGLRETIPEALWRAISGTEPSEELLSTLVLRHAIVAPDPNTSITYQLYQASILVCSIFNRLVPLTSTQSTEVPLANNPMSKHHARRS